MPGTFPKRFLVECFGVEMDCDPDAGTASGPALPWLPASAWLERRLIPRPCSAAAAALKCRGLAPPLPPRRVDAQAAEFNTPPPAAAP